MRRIQQINSARTVLSPRRIGSPDANGNPFSIWTQRTQSFLGEMHLAPARVQSVPAPFYLGFARRRMVQRQILAAENIEKRVFLSRGLAMKTSEWKEPNPMCERECLGNSLCTLGATTIAVQLKAAVGVCQCSEFCLFRASLSLLPPRGGQLYHNIYLKQKMHFHNLIPFGKRSLEV
jgi:hypothetical protein